MIFFLYKYSVRGFWFEFAELIYHMVNSYCVLMSIIREGVG